MDEGQERLAQRAARIAPGQAVGKLKLKINKRRRLPGFV